MPGSACQKSVLATSCTAANCWNPVPCMLSIIRSERMSEYFFVQSQDPLSESRCEHQYRLMASLAEAGHTVQVLLVQNGVMPARAGAHAPALEPLLDQAGLTVYADDYSLQ